MSSAPGERPSLEMSEQHPRTIVCDVGFLAVDATTIDALARLQLASRRLGHELQLCGVSRELVELIELCGLSGVLHVEVGRQPEQRE
jgi:anti-anti-sigma regulatory factor